MFKQYRLRRHNYTCNIGQLVDLYGLTDAEAALAWAFLIYGDEEKARQDVWQNHRIKVAASMEEIAAKVCSNPRRWRLRRRLLLEKYLRE